MKFSDLSNPQAAAAYIKEFRKRFNAKVCLSPTGGCSGAIVSAHTLSAEAMLRPISRDGHVYAIKIDLFEPKPEGPVDIGLFGIRNTSVFNGFCAEHDNALFSPIEDQQFACTPQQLFMYAYRAVAKESYLKRKQAESVPSPETMKAIHGLPKELELELSPAAIIFQAASLRGAEDIERLKSKMDGYLVAEEWHRLTTTIIPFAKQPLVVCSFVYSPDFDFDGHYLQDFENWDSDLSQLIVTIIPGAAGGFAMFSYLDSANAAPRRLVESLIAQPDITSSLLWLLFCQTETFAIAPDWYEALTTEQLTALKEAFLGNANPFDAQHDRLRNRRLLVDSWEPGKPFTM